MNFTADVKRFFGNISVEVKGSNVVIDGLPADFIEKDIYRIWRTNRICEHMFESMSRSRIVFNVFFLPDFYYALQRILVGKRMRCNRRAVEQLIFEIEEKTWLKNLNKTFPRFLKWDRLSNLKWTPEPHQQQWFEFFEQQVQKMNLKGTLLAAAPGSGKTFSAMAVNELLDSDVNVYIVPNNSVNDVWDVTHRDVLKNSEGRYWTSRQNKPLTVGYKAYIFHYEALDQAVDFFKANSKVYLQLKNTVTLDECHNFNNINSMRTELFIELCRILSPINILWMSGTPIKALGSEIIPLLTTTDPYFTDEVRDRFKKIFGMSSTTGLDILSHRLGIISYNIEKDNIRKHKVNTHRVDVRIPNGNDYTLETIRNRMSAYVAERMDYYQKNMNRYIDDYMSGLEHYEKKMKSSEKENYEIYRRYALTLHESYDPYVHKDEPVFCNKFEKTHILPVLDGAVKEKFKNAKSVYKYYHLKVQGEALGRILGRARTQCNIDVALNIKNSVVTNLQTNERDFVSLPDIINQSIKKTLLYTDYVEVVDSVCDQLKNSGYEPLKVYGDTNKDLSNIISVFTKNKKYNPLVATFKSLSTAVPMIMANTIIMLNTPFRDNDYTQTVSRCDRMGQDEDVEVFVVYLDTGNEPNISTRSKDIMEWSKEMVEAIMGKKSNIELAQESFDECLLDSMPAVTVSNKLPAWCQW